MTDEPQEQEVLEPEVAVHPDEVGGDPEEAKPSSADLVVADPNDRAAVMVVLDHHDEEQIIQAMQQRALKVMLYDFEAGGRQMVDLSWAGVRECVSEMNRTGKAKIRIQPGSLIVEEIEEEGEAYYRATVYAENLLTGQGQYGESIEPKRMKRGQKKVWDIFARTKAINKAQRNAYKMHIPEGLRQTLIAQYRGDDVAIQRIKLGAGAGALAELPPPLDTPEAEALRERARAIYAEIRGVSATFMLPAAFHANLSRVEHDMTRLEEFIAYLEERLGEARRQAEGSADDGKEDGSNG